MHWHATHAIWRHATTTSRWIAMIALGCIVIAAASFGLMYWLFGFEPNRFIEIAMQVLSGVIWVCGFILIFSLISPRLPSSNPCEDNTAYIECE